MGGGCGKRHQSPHECTDQLDRAVSKDHDDVPIGDASLVQVVGNGIGRLVDLAVRECPCWRPCPNVSSLAGRVTVGPWVSLRKTLGLGHTRPVGMGHGVSVEYLVDGADIATPVKVNCGIWEFDHRVGCGVSISDSNVKGVRKGTSIGGGMGLSQSAN